MPAATAAASWAARRTPPGQARASTGQNTLRHRERMGSILTGPAWITVVLITNND